MIQDQSRVDIIWSCLKIGIGYREYRTDGVREGF